MKRIVLPSVLILVVLLLCGPAFAQDEGSSAMVVFRPSVSVGYVGNLGDVHYDMTATVTTLNIGGTTNYAYRCFSSLYLDAGLAVDIGERLGLEVSTRWAPPAGTLHLRENVEIAGNPYGRAWKADTSWAVVDGNISYVTLKDVSIIKSLAPKIGVRWDRWNISADHPYDVTPGWAVPAPTDTFDSYVSIVMPYAGFSLVLGGLQWGCSAATLRSTRSAAPWPGATYITENIRVSTSTDA